MLNSTNLLRSHQVRHDPLNFRIMCLSATASAERPHALPRRSQVQAPTLEELPPEVAAFFLASLISFISHEFFITSMPVISPESLLDLDLESL